jgi:hypothetical protein
MIPKLIKLMTANIMTQNKVKDFIYSHQIIFIMVNGKIIKCQVMGRISSRMVNILKGQ